QASATTASLPIGVPVSSPRSVSMIGGKGWCSANKATPAGIDCVGTNPLEINGRRTTGVGRLLADSTLLADSPAPADSQVSARGTSVSRPIAPTPSTASAGGR